MPLKTLPLYFLLTLPLCAQQSVRYELSFPNAGHHEATVRAVFLGVNQSPLVLRMSRSSPGRYALHEFAKNVYSLRASSGAGQALEIRHPEASEWDVSGAHGSVIVEYTLYGDRVDGTDSAIDNTHAHLNMPATLIYARGFEHSPASLRFAIPQGSNWRPSTELKPETDGSWSAPDLEQLMDSPVELSNEFRPEWQIENATFRLALHFHGSEAEANAYAAMCKAVVLEEEGVFGALPKYDTGTYTFLIDYLPYASFDGMEHRDSTVISGPVELKGTASRQIGTVSHEFFHSWNVRRIRPKSLEPFDFDRADMSGELWFAEGFTNYYGILTLKRAGLSSLDDFASQMGSAVDQVLTSPGRYVHNVVEMSELAPFVDAATSIDARNFSNTFISYYTYGQALALGLDLTIRNHFPGKSLDDWMRTMWREHPDIDKPYTLSDLQQTLGETVSDPQFAKQVFDQHIFGKTPLDYSDALASAGLLLRKQHPGQVWLGARKIDVSEDGAAINSNTLRGSPLYNAGLDSGDRVERWSGKHFRTSADLDSWLARQKSGTQVSLQVMTRAGKKTVTLTFTENPALELVTYEAAGKPLTPAMESLRKAWLSSKAIHPLPEIPVMP